jgi:hypothetical protein
VTAARSAWRHWRPAALSWALWALAMLSLPVIAWLDHRSRQAGRADLVQLVTGSVPPVLALVSAATVGVVLASRRSRHPVGWLLLILGLSLAASGVVAAYTAYGLVARPGALPAAGAVARYAPTLVLAALPALSFVLLLTPTGSLPSARWRWWAWVTGTAPVVLLAALVVARGSLDPRYQAENSPLDFRGLGGALLVVNQVALGVTLLTVIVAAASLVVRFRRARGIGRQQLRWVAWAAVLVVLAAVIALASAALGLPEVVGWAAGICVALLPLAIGAAILRYRLYDLDHILSRTLTWGLLTVLLGGGYALVVLGLGQLVGQDSSLVVAAATLAVAALFQPARRRVQAVVDQRFNRRRHDAARIIEGFGAHLRDQVDLDTLTTDLLVVVNQTMQPTQASLWLRSPPGPSRTPPGALASP